MRNQQRQCVLLTLGLLLSACRPDAADSRACRSDEACPKGESCVASRCRTSPPMRLLTERLSSTGGSVEIESPGWLSSFVAIEFPNRQAVVCDTGDRKNAICTVAAEQLIGVTLGRNEVKLRSDDEVTAATLNVFRKSQFTDTARTSASIALGDRRSAWLRVTGGSIFSTEDSSFDRMIREYQVSWPFINLVGPRRVFTQPMALGTVFDFSNFIALLGDSQSKTYFDIAQCDLRFSDATFSMIYQTQFSKLAALVLNPQATLLALAGEGSDGPVRLRTIPLPGQSLPLELGSVYPPVLQLAVGRFLGDEQPGVVVLHQQGVSLLLQRPGSSAFEHAPAMSASLATVLPQSNRTRLAVADLDSDGQDDLVVAHEHGIDSVSFSPSGRLEVQRLLPALPGPIDSVAAGEVTFDGRPDLVVGWGGRVTVYPNQAP